MIYSKDMPSYNSCPRTSGSPLVHAGDWANFIIKCPLPNAEMLHTKRWDFLPEFKQIIITFFLPTPVIGTPAADDK